MCQRIEAPNEDDLIFVAKMLVFAESLASEMIGENFDGSLKDLERLQKILDTKQIEPEAAQTLHALGLTFGKIFLLGNEGFDWWMVEDEYGRDVCIRYKETTLLTFPQTMISKRIEDGKPVNIIEMYSGLVEKIQDLISENYRNA